MFSHIPERAMHNIRWVLTCGWLLLIASLFYDPISPFFTAPERTWSPFRIRPEECIAIQNNCLELKPYALGAPIFWGMIVPSSIFILLVFGHELWRRICPLSFLSQIPRALGWQRKFKRTDAKSGKIRYEIPKIKPNSWLGRNYLYLQFGLLFTGLCFRILFINGDRLFLGLWLTITIIAAITVGYLYGGKTWCNYFCPMAPVQKIYAEPMGLFTSKAHMSETPITQSMCRVVVEDNKEKSACVACQKPCIDIDAEGSYWEGLEKPQIQFIYYSYFGLVVGYFFYYYLYAGNWDYYFSGAWAIEGDTLEHLFSAGWYLYGQVIPIPKLLAVPITLGLFTAWGYVLGLVCEKVYRYYLNLRNKKNQLPFIRHHLFSICTFLAFNLVFIFGGRPFIRLLPNYAQEAFDILIVVVSSFWLMRVLKREPELYAREGLAGRFRKQLIKMNFPIDSYFSGRDIDDLNPHEVYVIAKVLPGFSKEKCNAYKGVLREALEEGYVNSANSLEVLWQLRTELGINDREHEQILVEVGIEDPTLLDPNRQRDLENSVRVSGYHQSLVRLITIQKMIWSNLENNVIIDPMTGEPEIRGEEKPSPEILKQQAKLYLERLEKLVNSYHGLNQPFAAEFRPIISLLRGVLRQETELLFTDLLHRLEQLDLAESLPIAQVLGSLSPTVLKGILMDKAAGWQHRLTPEILHTLAQPPQSAYCSLELPLSTFIDTLETLITEPNVLIKTVCLYLLQQFYPKRGITLAEQIMPQSDGEHHTLLQEIIPRLTKYKGELRLSHLPIFERIVYLFNSDFFASLDSQTLIELAYRADVKIFFLDENITEAGDTCRELLLLIEGSVEIATKRADGTEFVYCLLPGCILDELEVLTHTNLMGTIIAKAEITRILAIPVQAFDDLLEGDRHLAMKVLELESIRLKTLLQRGFYEPG
ncbi:cyclic nucleotide-binding domain-containing protein [Nodularia spumigena CS-591/04]|uniref:cyclic nucleotide-binding domain-containing protein n=1 Tax=Nodularia spumigena TaxID=70799 RepID=UPI00232D82A6|nr:cyclic nucleotide-binding domain-containing protein [Nodularia spumigena]MDB9333010.1 cyclic nucleotide-binding domain-containing protein [Nodularia spumigena CS-591/04]